MNRCRKNRLILNLLTTIQDPSYQPNIYRLSIKSLPSTPQTLPSLLNGPKPKPPNILRVKFMSLKLGGINSGVQDLWTGTYKYRRKTGKVKLGKIIWGRIRRKGRLIRPNQKTYLIYVNEKRKL